METITLEISEAQLVEWVRNLSPSTKRAVLKALVSDLDELDEMVEYGRQRMQAICAERGIDWDTLSEHERQQLVDEILHED